MNSFFNKSFHGCHSNVICGNLRQDRRRELDVQRPEGLGNGVGGLFLRIVRRSDSVVEREGTCRLGRESSVGRRIIGQMAVGRCGSGGVKRRSDSGEW